MMRQDTLQVLHFTQQERVSTKLLDKFKKGEEKREQKRKGEHWHIDTWIPADWTF